MRITVKKKQFAISDSSDGGGRLLTPSRGFYGYRRHRHASPSQSPCNKNSHPRAAGEAVLHPPCHRRDILLRSHPIALYLLPRLPVTALVEMRIAKSTSTHVWPTVILLYIAIVTQPSPTRDNNAT